MGDPTVVEVLGKGRWTRKQLGRALSFSQQHPRIWWALHHLPHGELRDHLTDCIVNERTISDRYFQFLWRRADELEARAREESSGEKTSSEPGHMDRVNVVAEVDQVTLRKGRMLSIGFDAPSGWRGRVVLSRRDGRFEELDVQPEDLIRVQGVCLSATRGRGPLVIGDLPGRGRSDPGEKTLSIEVVSRPCEEDWE